MWAETRRHEIKTRGSERMTATESRERHPSTSPESETVECKVGIVRARRQMPAMKADQRRE
jgi:hypothetical protein